MIIYYFFTTTSCRPVKPNLVEEDAKVQKLTIAAARWIIRDTKTLIFETFQMVFNCKKMKFFFLCDLSHVLVSFAFVADVKFWDETQNSKAINLTRKNQ